ncbi:MAG: YdcF family protein [Defluviitaleaceae bacterium]|nr:YdcF family protein [Defluviitaleaceae bacterium]
MLTIINLFFANFNFGFIMAIGISCFFIACGLLLEKLVKIKWLAFCVLAGSLFIFGTMVFLGIYGSISTATFNEDAVIVLGAGIKGETIPRMLAHRLDRAVEYSVQNPYAVIVVSGGLGSEADITEALAMKRYLVANGVPEERIIKEEESTSTFENLAFSKEILDTVFDEQYKIVIITNNFHIFRSVQLARSLGLDVNHCGAVVDVISVPINFSREVAAVFQMWVFGI